MSSMRNAVQRRNHKERSQPREREKWGVLEKHKDYSLRAKDYNKKKSRLKILRQKASDRNPDEFYYGMLNSSTNRGRKVADRGNTALSHDAVKLLKTQDAAYLQNAIKQTERSIEKLEQEFSLGKENVVQPLAGEVKGSGRAHILFAEDEGEQKLLALDTIVPSTSMELTEEDVDDAENATKLRLGSSGQRSKRQREREIETAREAKKWQTKHRKEQNARRMKLEALKLRRKDLRDAENELELQRAKMNNTVGGVTKSGKRWRIRERKK